MFTHQWWIKMLIFHSYYGKPKYLQLWSWITKEKLYKFLVTSLNIWKINKYKLTQKKLIGILMFWMFWKCDRYKGTFLTFKTLMLLLLYRVNFLITMSQPKIVEFSFFCIFILLFNFWDTGCQTYTESFSYTYSQYL